MIKVKAHRGCPLNEEVDIRAEMGRMKEEQEESWSEPTNRTIYQWSEISKTKTGTLTTKQSAWTQAVRNRMRQKAGEIQAYRALEKGAGKTRHPDSKYATNPERGRESIKTASSCPTSVIYSTRSPLSSPHRCSSPVLATDPWRTSPTGISKMKILVQC